VRIVSWNVNSVRLRLNLVRRILRKYEPDVLCLQEIKVENDLFPAQAFSRAGYPHHAIHGQKGYHGVAVIARIPLLETAIHQWGGIDDCRHLRVQIDGDIEINNFYVPAGGDVPDPKANPKFAHKLQFLREVAKWFGGRRDEHLRGILVGDLNIAPLESDVWSHKQLLKIVSHTPVEVDHLERLQNSLDWVDAVRHFVPPPEKIYSWWSYRARDWAAADRGRRLDHIWVTPALAPGLRAASIAREVRAWKKPSDHVPVVVDLDI
jgi:exodeoxyribonuclease-3